MVSDTKKAPEYAIGTVWDMAAIPEEAMPRFLAELPAIIAEARRMISLTPQFADMGYRLKLEASDGLVWVDDDKRSTTTTLTLPDGDAIRVTRPMGGAA